MADASRQQLGDEDAKAFLQIVVELNAQHQKLLARAASLSSEDPRSHAALERKRLEEFAACTEDTMEYSMDLYSRAISSNFASHILQLLPREIRDMIYHELVGSESSVYRYGTKSTEDVILEDFPHFYKQDYMGVEFTSELVETIYRYHNFVLDHQTEVPAFLSNCRFGTGINPAAHVTSLTVGITLGRYSASASRYYQWRSTKWDYPLRRHFQKAIKPLDVLKKISPKRGSSIQFSNRRNGEDYNRKFAEVLMPLIYELKEKGWKVLCWEPKFEGPWETLTFDSSRDAWDEKIRTDSVFASDDPEGWEKYGYRRRRAENFI